MLYQLSYVRARPRLAQSLVRGIAPNALPADHLSMFKLQEWRSEEGQTMAEYGVILAVITPAIIAALALVAYKTAENVEFAKTLTFSSSEGIPSVLRLRSFAEQFMGAR